MSVRKIIAGLLFSGISLLALSGCAVGPENNNPTQLTSQWVDPAATFEQKTITGLLVTAVVENPTNRRIFGGHRMQCPGTARHPEHTELPRYSPGLEPDDPGRRLKLQCSVQCRQIG